MMNHVGRMPNRAGSRLLVEFGKEYSRNCEDGDKPYYPIRLVKDKEKLNKYLDSANKGKCELCG